MHESARPLVCVRPPGWTHAQAQPFKALMTWVQRAETLGFDGVFVGDRLLSEASRAGEVVYGATMLDAMVTLSAIAAGTEKVLLGPLVLVFPFRHPIQPAKLDDVAKPLCGHQSAPRAGALDDGVGGNGCPVEKAPQFVGIDPCRLKRVQQA